MTPRDDGTAQPRGRRATWAVAAALAVTAAVAGGAAVVGPALGDDCPDGVESLSVAAAPELAEVVAQVADDAAERGACWRAEVTSRAPGQALDDLATQREDWQVWLPDSSIWVDRARDEGVDLASISGPVATSPVVLALPGDEAARVGEHPAVVDVLATGGTARPVPLAWPDPDRSAPTVAALLGLQQAAQTRKDGRADLVGLLGRARKDLSMPAEEHLGELAVPVAEQAVWAYNATSDSPVIAAYTSAPGSALDYPFVVTDAKQGTLVAAAALLGELRSADGRALLLARGFRDPAGQGGTALDDAVGVVANATTGVGPPTTADLVVARTMLQTLSRPSRLLAVIDVSGSMGAEVPGLPGVTRIAYAMEAAAAGLGMLPPGSEAGLWEFSTDLAPGSDHREVVPMGEIAGSHGRLLAAGLRGLTAIPDGGTGLYDTTLAAVRRMRADFDPMRTNAVVLLTDGANSDDDGLDLTVLLDRLRAENDPARPVPVIAVAYGKDVDAGALRAISAETGGAAYVAVDPRRIRTVLQDAIGQRLCRPDCGS